MDNTGESGQKVQTSSYKRNNSSVCNVQHGDYKYQYCNVYWKVARKVDLKSSHQKINCNYMR